MHNLADDPAEPHRWPVLVLLAAGVPVTLLADLFAAHGPDSEHIYRHEPASHSGWWLQAPGAELAQAGDRVGA